MEEDLGFNLTRVITSEIRVEVETHARKCPLSMGVMEAVEPLIGVFIGDSGSSLFLASWYL